MCRCQGRQEGECDGGGRVFEDIRVSPRVLRFRFRSKKVRDLELIEWVDSGSTTAALNGSARTRISVRLTFLTRTQPR